MKSGGVIESDIIVIILKIVNNNYDRMPKKNAQRLQTLSVGHGVAQSYGSPPPPHAMGRLVRISHGTGLCPAGDLSSCRYTAWTARRPVGQRDKSQSITACNTLPRGFTQPQIAEERK